MPPDVPNGGLSERLARLERTVSQYGTDIARIEAQVSSNTELIRAMGPLVSQLATVMAEQRHLQMGIDDLKREWRDDVRHFDTEIEKITEGQAQEARDSRSYRRTLTSVGIAAILSPVFTVVINILFNKP
jgi:predicted  nucleic acid-binding Zn-ribbon protein